MVIIKLFAWYDGMSEFRKTFSTLHLVLQLQHNPYPYHKGNLEGDTSLQDIQIPQDYTGMTFDLRLLPHQELQYNSSHHFPHLHNHLRDHKPTSLECTFPLHT